MGHLKESGINQDKIQELNKALLLNLIREKGECSRAVLSQATGLNKATITYMVNDFIEKKCVEETGLLVGEKGRRSIGIALSNKAYFLIGIRLARTYFKVAVFNLRGEIEEVRRETIEKDFSAGETITEIIQLAEIFLKKNKQRRLLGVGMAIPGPFLKEKGEIGVLTGRRGLERIGFKEKIEKALNTKVFMEHDAKAGAFAQLWYDKEINKDSSLIYIAAGEGVGAGIVLNQEIVYGEQGTAGEIGHMTIDYNGERCECGNRGCLEKYCSILAVRNEFKKKYNKDYSIEGIRKMVRANDLNAVQIYRRACRFLGYGMVNVVNSYNPTVIILGDEFSHIDGKIILEEINNVLKERLLPEIYQNLTVKISAVVNDSVLHGIGAMVIKRVFD
ncbi:MAG: ROK family protein, partial [Candidatus Avilachnospira sp.]